MAVPARADYVLYWDSYLRIDEGVKTVSNNSRVVESWGDNPSLWPTVSFIGTGAFASRNAYGDAFKVNVPNHGDTWKWQKPKPSTCANDADVYTGIDTAGGRGQVFWWNSTHGLDAMTRFSRVPMLSDFDWTFQVNWTTAFTTGVWTALLTPLVPKVGDARWFCNGAVSSGSLHAFVVQLAPIGGGRYSLGGGYLDGGTCLNLVYFDSAAQITESLIHVSRRSGNMNLTVNNDYLGPCYGQTMIAPVYEQFDLSTPNTNFRSVIRFTMNEFRPGLNSYANDAWETGIGNWTSETVGFNQVLRYVYFTVEWKDFGYLNKPPDRPSLDSFQVLSGTNAVLFTKTFLIGEQPAYAQAKVWYFVFQNSWGFDAGGIPSTNGFKLRFTLSGDTQCGCSTVTVYNIEAKLSGSPPLPPSPTGPGLNTLDKFPFLIPCGIFGTIGFALLWIVIDITKRFKRMEG